MYCCSLSALSCAFWDAFLLTTLAQSDYLEYGKLPLFSSTELRLTGCLFFIALFWINSTDCCVWKSHEISRYWNTQSSLSGTKKHATVKITMIPFFPYSHAWCAWYPKLLERICMILCTARLSTDWLIKWLPDWLEVKVFLINRSLSVYLRKHVLESVTSQVLFTKIISYGICFWLFSY